MPHRRVVVFSSAATRMAPSPLDPEIVNLLKKSGLGIPGSDLQLEQEYRVALSPYIKRTRDLFRGSFQHMSSAIQDANGACLEIDHYVISPRYGIIDLDERIIPYRFSLAHSSRAEVQQASARLGIGERLRKILSKGYDLCFVVANKNDLMLLHDPSSGKDLASMCPSLTVISAGSASFLFDEKVRFFGISNIGKRSRKFLHLLNELTTMPLSNYNGNQNPDGR